MNKKIKAMWLKALRSGKFKQGKGTLYQQTPRGDDRFCCLGVLAHFSDERPWRPCTGVNGNGNTEFHLVGRTGMLPDDLLKKLGLSYQEQSNLASMNDLGYSFKRIAKWIEKSL